MSGPYQVPSFNASNPNSSLSPQPRGNTPLSFRTNVNRAKTRRWVEAKKYSYDGDEWGDDEYGEYDQDDNKSALQDQHAGVNRSTPDISSTLPGGMPRPPLPSMDRAHSMDRVQTLSADTSAAPSSSPASIVRPADIYRRMREDPNSSASVNSPLIDHGSGASTPVQATNFGVDGNSESNNNPAPATSTANELPAISLPEVKRLSVFSPDLFSEPETTQTRGPTGQPHQLQHNPSLGFRSAVNQAFDVETPSTATDSVARSDSGSTAAISPIIAHRSTTTGQNTPTIEEEPGENIETPTENNIGFRPGHRRDLSLPSSGSSPSRKPMVTEPNTSASPESAHLSARTPSESAVDAPLSSQQQSSEPSDSYSPSQGLSERDRPAPLSVQTSVPPGPSATTENVPVIVPSMSTETSPEDTENDRLRKEIIRSLSRENTPSDQDTPPQTSRQDNLLPTGYESYRDEQPPAAPAEQGPSAPTFNAAHAAEAPSSEPAAPIPQQGAKPKLQRRFSWEESSDDEEPTPATQEQAPRPPAMPGQYPFPQERIQPDVMVAPASQLSEGVNPVRGMDGPGLAPTPAPASEKPRLTVVPPSAVDAGSAPSNSQVPESAQPQTMETLARAEDGQSPDLGRPPMGHPPQTPPASNESGLLGFKDILGIQSPEERIDAFNRTRGQFAVIDTGLSHWVRVTIHAHPEHSDVVQRNSQPLSEEFKNSVPRTKFPKLSSLGNLASSLQDGSHSGSGHIRRPSGHLGSMKQHQVGKDFLHTAGVLGGQAGKAAKGFFSKSRSKLKGSGEKGFQSTHGYHRPVRLSDLQQDSETILDQESPPNLRDSPSSRLPTGNQGEKASTKSGEELFVRPWVASATGQFDRQTAGQQRPAGSCPIERQREPHQDYSSSLPSKDDDARCQDVEHSSAKPRDGQGHDPASNDAQGIGGHKEDNPAIAPRVKQSNTQFQIPVLRIPEQETRDSFESARTPGLRHLPSVSSLGLQDLEDVDLDPTPPPQKLAQSNRSSRVSAVSDVGESHPRHLGGSLWPPLDKTSQEGKRPESPLAQAEAIQSQTRQASDRHHGRASSTSESAFSPQHDRYHQPGQISSLQDPASPRTSSSPMEKLKNVGRFRRTSTGPAEFRTGQSPKNPLSRLAGLFGRTHHRKTGPPGPVSSPSESSIGQHIAPVSYRDYRIASASISSFDNHDRPFSLPDGRNTFRGQRPPAEGYFAHESPESFFLAQSQHSVRAAASTDYLRLSDPTPVDAGRLSHHLSPPYHSPPISQHPPHTSSPRLSSPIRSRSPRTPPSRGRSEERTYAQELHLRSRSPKAFAPRPEERNLPKHDPTDPAFKLGTFRSSNPRTSRIGDQELPWKITIPGDSDDEPVDRSTSWRQETEGVLDVTRLPTYQEDAEEHGHTEHAGDVKQDSALSNRSTTSNDTRQPPPDPAPAEHPHRSGARAINTVGTPVELPVRTGDDSDEEIMMSSTAYPGQEWRPVGFSEWEHQ